MTLVLLNMHSMEVRRFPEIRQPVPRIVNVATEKDAYAAYKKQGLWGTHVIHLNRHMNLVDFFPREAVSAPFPIKTYDIRPEYEMGINSHNWLFVATRSGMVRSITSVLPEASFREKYDALLKDAALTFNRGYFRGFTYDIPWTIATVDTLPVTADPVIVSIDAGYFLSGADPVTTALSLKKRLPDVRMITLITSDDEPDITEEAIISLKRFEAAWKGV